MNKGSCQHCISVMRAKVLKMRFYALNKLCGILKVNRFKIPHYAYT
jgi:hypothetical protein